MPGDAFLFDAMRHEIARIGTLGIAGFDATVSDDGIVEPAYRHSADDSPAGRLPTVRA